MRPMTVLIIDDERLARQKIRRLLLQDSDIVVVGECGNGAEAAEAIRSVTPELVFLDIQMPGVDGFGMLRNLPPEKTPLVVFVTAYDEYAVQAFEAQAFSYLLKPFEDERFFEILRRAKSQILLQRNGDVHGRLEEIMDKLVDRPARTDRIMVRQGKRMTFVKVTEIDWVEAADNYLCLHCGPETHVIRETMNSLERSLDNSKFLRIHRSTIVNLDRIQAIEPWAGGDYRVLLRDGTNLTLSRTYRDRLRRPLEGE
jgi:two-component system LytT family response regulator